MAELTKTTDIAAFPQTESTSNMTTFGCVKHQLSENFNESHRYSAGDTVVYNGRHYQFQSSHYGVWTGSDATLSTEPFIAFEPTTRQDLSVITDGLDRLAEETALPPTFSATIEYFAGDKVLYNEVRYEFTERHYGAWTGTDVTPVETSLFSLNRRDDVYPAQIGVSSDNPAMDRTGRRITLHNITDNRVYSLKTGADGYVSFDLKKDCEWTFDGGEIDGYTKGTKVQFVTTAKNPGTDKFHVNYLRDTGTVTMTAQIFTSDGVTGNIGSKNVYVCLPDDYRAYSASTNASGNCIIDVPKNKRCLFFFPQLTNITSPDNRVLETVSNMDKMVEVTYPIEIYYVDGTDFREYEFKDYPKNQDGTYDTSHPLVSLHFASKELLRYGLDFYVRPNDLTQTQLLNFKKQWASSNAAELPNVTKSTSTTELSAYDGPTMTDAMISDCQTLGYTTAAANYAKNDCTYTHKGKVCHGFIGTYRQSAVLFNNYRSVTDTLSWFGITVYFYGNNNSRYYWTSTQYSAANAYYWNGTAFANASKANSYAVIPFFTTYE